MSGFVVIVPARAGSKGAPGKNIRLFGGVPLWRHAADQGLAAGAERVLVTTDIREILDADLPSGIVALPRPSELAGDSVAMAPVLTQVLADEALRGKHIILLQPTSPLRSIEDIRAAHTLYDKGEFDLVLTAVETDRGVLKYGTRDGDRFVALREPDFCFSNRQALPPVWKPNGAVYVFGRDWFLGNGGFVSDRIGMVAMPLERSQDIDTDEDFARTEAAFLAQKG